MRVQIFFVQLMTTFDGTFQDHRSTPTLLQSIQEPLPPNSILSPSASVVASAVNNVAYSSQLSLETAEADAQVGMLF